MHKNLCLAAALSLVLGSALSADPADLRDLDKTVFNALAAKASSNVNITLDGTLLKLGASFLSDSDDEDAAQIKRIIAGLKGITIRSFEFKNKGEYSEADVAAIRKAMDLPDWSRVVDVHSKSEEEDAEIYVLPGKDKLRGLFILAREPLELTAIYIVGSIDPKDVDTLQKLGREKAKGEQ